ncbi:hypothetical protein BDR05DRAFT_1003495 [Suillus weaverae]|nr:hypothetical protein BDR05DRAFT_1003495 [Suillus weaverae]
MSASSCSSPTATSPVSSNFPVNSLQDPLGHSRTSLSYLLSSHYFLLALAVSDTPSWKSGMVSSGAGMILSLSVMEHVASALWAVALFMESALVHPVAGISILARHAEMDERRRCPP